VSTTESVEDVERVQLAAQVSMYGYPLAYNLHEIDGSANNIASLPFGAPYSQFGYACELLGPKTEFTQVPTADHTRATTNTGLPPEDAASVANRQRGYWRRVGRRGRNRPVALDLSSHLEAGVGRDRRRGSAVDGLMISLLSIPCR
jgi:hypothetical protein